MDKLIEFLISYGMYLYVLVAIGIYWYGYRQATDWNKEDYRSIWGCVALLWLPVMFVVIPFYIEHKLTERRRCVK